MCCAAARFILLRVKIPARSDADVAKEACQKGCLYDKGKVHRADYDLKVRGGPQLDRRFRLEPKIINIIGSRF